jgi:hypothetical protein
MCVCVCVCVESQPRKLYSAGYIGENSNLILFFSGTFVIRLCVHTYSAINQKEIVELRPYIYFYPIIWVSFWYRKCKYCGLFGYMWFYPWVQAIIIICRCEITHQSSRRLDSFAIQSFRHCKVICLYKAIRITGARYFLPAIELYILLRTL